MLNLTGGGNGYMFSAAGHSLANKLRCEARGASIDYHRFTALSIMLIKEAACSNGIAHDVQVAGSYAGGERDQLLVGRQRIGAGPVWQDVFPVAHRDDI